VSRLQAVGGQNENCRLRLQSIADLGSIGYGDRHSAMRILFFAHLKTVTGQAEMHWPISDSVDADGLWQQLLATWPELARIRGSVRLACNGEYVGAAARFRDPDEVALIPPVSGG
jgi:molybdopterin converting factor subunit 1